MRAVKSQPSLSAKALACLMSAVLCIGLAPSVAMAAPSGSKLTVGSSGDEGLELTTASVPATVYVGSQDVSEGGYWTYSNGSFAAGSSSNYNVSYNKTEGSLTLKNFTYAGTGYESAGNPNLKYIGVYADGDLSLQLEGMNNITVSDRAAEDADTVTSNYGMFISGKFTVSGAGSLTVTAGAVSSRADASCGIATNGAFTLMAPAKITATGGTAEGWPNDAISAGVYSGGIVNVDSGATLNATGGTAVDDCNSYGVYAYSIFVAVGTVNATGGTTQYSGCNSYGLFTGGACTLQSGAKMTATGGASKEDSYGLYATGAFTVRDGATAILTGSECDETSCGAYLDNNLTVAGTLKATGGAAEESYGIEVSSETVSISGTVTATSDAAKKSCGFYMGFGDYTVSGTLVANGGNSIAAYNYCGAESYGLQTGTLKITETGKVTATSGTATSKGSNARSIGAIMDNPVIKSGGTLTATGGAAKNDLTSSSSYEVLSIGLKFNSGYSTSTIGEGAKITAIGGTVATVATEKDKLKSCGLYLYGMSDTNKAIVNVSGGQITAKSSAATDGYGVYNDGQLNIYYGNVTAAGSARSVAKVEGDGVSYGNDYVRLTVDDSVNVKVSSNVDGSGAAAWNRTEPLKNYKYFTTSGGFIPYGVYVGGVAVNSGNADNITGAGITGKASYDVDSNTLVLNGFSYEGAGRSGKNAAIASDHDLNIELVGTSTVKNVFDSAVYSRGVYINGDLAFSGTGTLNAVSADASNTSQGVLANKKVTLGNGVTVKAIGGEARANSAGVSAGGALAVENGATLIAVGGTATTGETPGATSWGVNAGTNAVYVRGGTLTAIGSAATALSYGIQCGSLYQYGGTVVATGDSTKVQSYGVYTSASVNIFDGIMSATAGDVTVGSVSSSTTPCSSGIRGGVAVSGGSLTATGGNVTTTDATNCESYGIRAFSNLVKVDGGAVVAQAGNASAKMAIYFASAPNFQRGVGTIVKAGDDAASATVIDDFSDLSGYAYLSAEAPANSLMWATMKLGTQKAYNGEEQNVVIDSVTLGGRQLKLGVDYEIKSGGTAMNVGQNSLVIAGINDYVGTKSASWSLQKASLEVAIPVGKTLTYNGATQTGVAAGAGYELSGTVSATNAGSYSAKATLLRADANREYVWSDDTTAAKTIAWKINPKAVAPTFALSETAYAYDGKQKTPAVTAKVGSTALKKDTDYSLAYASGRTDAGTYTVTVACKGNYKFADATLSFKIDPKKVTPTFKLAKTAYTWNGKAKKPAVAVKVKFDGKTYTLKKGTDYKVTYASGCKNVGTYKVTVACKGGNFTFAKKTLKFKINPKGTAAKAQAAANGALTVKWAKQAKKMSKSRITGYQVQVATNKSFKKGVKKATVKGFKKTSIKISKLKSKKAYYVRVRTYKKVGSATYYSPWSTYKKAVKTK